MGFPGCQKIWMNGTLVDFADAKIHVLSHVVHYGSSVFEGMRFYDTERGPAVFRLPAHTRRLLNSAKIYRMSIPFSAEDLNGFVLETIRANGLRAGYVRPIVYRGFAALGVNPERCPVDVVIAVWEWGAYLGAEALEQGVDVRVSSWTRLAPNTLPAMAKAGANYMNSQLINMEARLDGYAEGVALDAAGYVSEGSGENLFVVTGGKVLTPPLGTSVLPGITRDTVITLARDMGYAVEEHAVPRELLYIADEVFFTGSAAEVTPVRSVDRIAVGDGRRGPVTTALQEAYFGVTSGRTEDGHGWLTPIYAATEIPAR